jgi:hypothetical protein
MAFAFASYISLDQKPGCECGGWQQMKNLLAIAFALFALPTIIFFGSRLRNLSDETWASHRRVAMEGHLMSSPVRRESVSIPRSTKETATKSSIGCLVRDEP